jgi:DNA-binding MarR family transcriptional regulator
LRWQRALTAELSPLRITYAQFFVLGSLNWLLKTGEAPQQRQVAAHAGLDAMTVSQILRALEERGWVTREKDPDDARAFRLGVSPAGKRVFRRAVARVHAVDLDFFSALGKNERGFGDQLAKLAQPPTARAR